MLVNLQTSLGNTMTLTQEGYALVESGASLWGMEK